MGIRFATPVHTKTDSVPRWTGQIADGKLVYVVDVDIGTLPNSTTNLIPHGLTISAVVSVEGSATDGTHTLDF